MSSLGESLKKKWLSQRITLNAGASLNEVTWFETKYNVLLPEDFREYFLTTNGFDGSEHWEIDENMITFLGLNEVKPLSEYWSSPVAGGDSYFVFADYSIAAHVYAIRLVSTVTDTNPVVVLWDRQPIQVANSFTEFVEAYLETKDSVLFPGPEAQQTQLG
ncbi:MAG TPA: SMI1/KNR4 family protein [Pyrinomonadaceae bacterium]|nr:SMI1/KNR4 family protein [Pyrinomonadaceae bacterium]